MDGSILDLDGCFRVLAAVVRVAAKDATAGSDEAAEFLERIGVDAGLVQTGQRNILDKRRSTMLPREQVAPPAFDLSAFKAAQADAAAEHQAMLDRIRAEAQVRIDAKAKAKADAEQAKLVAHQTAVEAALRREYTAHWQGSAEDFVTWWLNGGRIEALAAQAAKVRAESDRRLVAAAADW